MSDEQDFVPAAHFIGVKPSDEMPDPDTVPRVVAGDHGVIVKTGDGWLLVETHPARTVNLAGHSILVEFHEERLRAHRKYVGDSCEEKPWDHPDLFRTWIEEVMEAVQAHAAGVSEIAALRKELVQVGAMTEMWVQAIDSASRHTHAAAPQPPLDTQTGD